MISIGKSTLKKAFLSNQIKLTLTESKGFSYLIKELPKEPRKVPHPEHVKNINFWRNIFFIAGIPAVLAANINYFFLEEQHPKRVEFKPYAYMRFRNKKFPWGDGKHTLFHNEYYNAQPEGYDTSDDYLEKLEHAHDKHKK